MNLENRREFLKKTGLIAVGFPHIARGWLKSPPSDKIRVATIGTGGQGKAHIRWFSKMKDVDLVALCDVDSRQLRAGEKLRSSLQPNVKADLYANYQHIIDRKDIDAITYATPDHWHSLLAIHAFEAGKDVYGEKPLSHSVKEGQAMLAAQQKYKSIFQLGTQIHAGENYHRVAEIIQSGILGEIHTVRLWKQGGSPGLGFPISEEPPGWLNWDKWLGPAPYSPYTPVRCHRSFRYFFDYSGGVFADFWCHIADIMFMSLDPKGLSAINAHGEIPMDGIANTPKWIDVDFDFDRLKVYWTTTPPSHVIGAKDMSIGAHFEGEKGTLTCDYHNRTIQIGTERMKDIGEVPKTLPRSPGHQRNFLDSVKSRKKPESYMSYARVMTLPMELALISFRLKRSLKWESEKEQFIGDATANAMLFQPYRSPYRLPDHA